MEYIWNITLFILKGASVSLKIYVTTAVFCVPLGILFALGKISKNKALNALLDIYTWVFRGTPLLLQLFFAYYGLPLMGITMTPFTAASLTFIINYAAYLTEIFRAGIESIDKGQYEAAHSLGMSYTQTMRRIIIPQTIRRVLPPMCNEAITLVKDTALVTAIGMGDILRAAKEVLTRDFTIIPFVIAAVLYLIMSWVIVAGFKKIEQKYSVY
ncbi:amino acid ABC transporter membrane protein, PAAT family (TC 3.A.1.3.-) [Peptoclostridium litorale DSM 5388]|uniref:Arginine transport system permease protein ArtQ n=1 Tax=Peptoclostridium litorale DSM 5388 TaxID=1121324 RepID=A0A069RD67_PEPLI|nr:amino acid ABC transporter permease [Peptoclostridium litorale]KDR94703.1 arginine transport system permease protein ArtQ [Peptoclostridium litorale DSM 5388]SIO32847.1 amino acid ABC transporter membrane protein, PAAT family (TC 3.A.1.3.-) [Peptoclostridium litorale DSM 5388]